VLPPTVRITKVTKVNGKLEVTAEATPGAKGEPVQSLRLKLDGRNHPAAEPVKIDDGADAKAVWTIDPLPGHHELKVLALCPDVSGISEAYSLNAPPADDQKPRLYRVCVGINKYDQEGLRLGAARQDAEAVFQALKDYCTKDNLFRDGWSDEKEAKAHLIVDEKADRKTILAALKSCKKAKPGDLVVFFFGGHGVKQKDDFFLLTREADILKELKGQSLSDEDLRTALGEIPCSVLLLMDACHSSAGVKVFKEFTSMKKASDDLTRSLTDDQVAVTVLSAAMAHEIAREGKDHGLFTEALLAALKAKAGEGVPFDAHERQMYVHHLYSHVFSEVRRASEGKQNPFLNMPWTVPPLAVRLVPDK
jgi:uncharacterized caspase-like protein